MILGIETSCDDTCAAVVTADGKVRSNVVASQGLLHARYGGVVPEVAARRHLELVDAVTADALEAADVSLDDVESVAVTRGPGLIGALLVGVSAAKALAAARRLPLTPVNHLHGHVTACAMGPEPIEPPYVCLVASGGHTFLARVDELGSHRVLGQTLDDAAGEAFDKGARILGLGYPGGPEIDRLAREGDPEAFAFPRSAPGGKAPRSAPTGKAPLDATREARLEPKGEAPLKDSAGMSNASHDGKDSAGMSNASHSHPLNFSFSGLKTALLYRVRDLGEGVADRRADLAASFQRAIVEALVARVRAAVEREGAERVAIGGGVAANAELRAAVEDLGVPAWVPPMELCTDNAAMIAGAARFAEPLPYPDYLALDAEARP